MVIITCDIRSTPSSADLDAEMVVGILSQIAGASPAFKQCLCKSDTGWNFVAVHLFNSCILIFINVLLISSVSLCKCDG